MAKETTYAKLRDVKEDDVQSGNRWLGVGAAPVTVIVGDEA